MPTKLHIDLSRGVIDVEGNESFVKSIYDDFREEALKNFSPSTKPDQTTPPPSQAPAGGGAGGKSKKAKANKTLGGKTKSSDYKPKFKSDMDLSGVSDFYDQYLPKNHSEKILIFAQFLEKELKITPLTADDIYSCYFTLQHKIDTPQAFAQTLRNARTLKGYLNFTSIKDISVSIAGGNHFNRGLKKNSGD